MLIYDVIKEEYDEVIPRKKIEEKIEEYQNNMKLYENEVINTFNENNIRQEVITVLQQLIKENCEDKDE